MDEVAIDGRCPADGRVPSFQRGLGAIDDRLDSGIGTVDGRERLDERRVALAPVLRRGGGGDPVDGAQSRCDGYRVATLLDEHVERLQHARRDPGRGVGVPADDRITITGYVFQTSVARVA